MNLITGRAGVAHITPRQDAMWHQGLIETESCIFDAYENFAAEIITNNEVRIRSGVGMLQGRFFCIEPNTYDSADIANGNQGEYRKDLIVARITVDASTNTQSASIEVIQGTPAAENPTAPEAVTGDLDAGDLIADYPLAEVLLNGINIESLTPVFDTGWLFNGAGRQKLNYIGTNPITSTADDTPVNWAALGTGVAYFNGSGKLNNQPTTYGFVENIVAGNLVYQTFYSMNGNSSVWHRSGGAASGWYPNSANWVKSLDENNGIQMKELWQNASPTSNFAAQSTDINLSGYDAVLIKCRTSTGSTETASYIGFVGENILMNHVYNLTNSSVPGDCVRKATITTSEITYTVGQSKDHTDTAAVARANMMIPYVVYGIKGVQ